MRSLATAVIMLGKFLPYKLIERAPRSEAAIGAHGGRPANSSKPTRKRIATFVAHLEGHGFRETGRRRAAPGALTASAP